MEHFKKFLIIFVLVIFLMIFVGILFNKYPWNPHVENGGSSTVPPPAPAPQSAITWSSYSWADPASGTIKRIPYPSNWVVQENFNRINQVAGVFIHPQGSAGDDRISIGGYGIVGGQFLSACSDIRSFESNHVRCDDSSGISVATKSSTTDIIKIYTLLVADFKGEINL